MKIRRGIGWWLTAAVYVAVVAVVIHETAPPFPIRLDSIIVVKRG